MNYSEGEMNSNDTKVIGFKPKTKKKIQSENFCYISGCNCGGNVLECDDVRVTNLLKI